jgi:hypothetical protein
MHMGMRMRFAGRENEKDSAGRRNENDRTQNDSLPFTVLISSRDMVCGFKLNLFFLCLFNILSDCTLVF